MSTPSSGASPLPPSLGSGARALPWMFDAILTSADADTVVSEGLSPTGIAPETILPAIVTVTQDEEPLFRCKALLALEGILMGKIDRRHFVFERKNVNAAIDALYRALDDFDGLVRIIAARAVFTVDRGTEAAVRALDELIARGDDPYHEMAVDLAAMLRSVLPEE